MNTHNFNSRERGSIGPIVGLVIILGIILAGGVYFYTTIKSTTQYEEKPAPEQTGQTKQNTELDTTTQILNQSTSTDPSAIQQDLNSFDSTQIGNIGSDL